MDPMTIGQARSYEVTIDYDPYFARPVFMRWPNDTIQLYTCYNLQGYVTHEGQTAEYTSDCNNQGALRVVEAMTPTGQLLSERYNNGTRQMNDYYPSTWQVKQAG